MRHLHKPVLTFALLSISLGFAEQNSTSITVPPLGLVYDREAHGIRPLLGSRGAALLADPIDLGFPVAIAALASREQIVVAVSADDGKLRVVSLRSGRPEVHQVDDTLTSPDIVVLSPSGRVAALYRRSDGVVQVVSGVAEIPVAARQIAVDRSRDDVASLALSDDGQAVLWTAGDSVWLVEDSNPVLLPLSASAVAFRRDSREAIAVARSGEVHLIGAGGAVTQYGIIPAGNPAGNPAGVYLSANGKSVYAVDADGLITVLDSVTGVSKTISCYCKPSGISATNSSAMFRLNEPSGSPLMLLDVSTTDPRVWFVPAARAVDHEGSVR